MFDALVPLSPACFFSVAFPIYLLQKDKWLKQHRVPRIAHLDQDATTSDVYVGWNEQGLAIKVAFPSIQQSFYPDIRAGECLEIMIDTRDVKQASTSHRYCHHFFFLPKKIQEIQAAEITHFKTDDAHPLCDPKLLQVHMSGKQMQVWIPKEVLTGYEPETFNRIGFAYRINSSTAAAQQVPLSAEDVAIEKHPGKWVSCELLSKESA